MFIVFKFLHHVSSQMSRINCEYEFALILFLCRVLVTEPPMSAMSEEDRQMKEMLGFGSFHSTKGERGRGSGSAQYS